MWEVSEGVIEFLHAMKLVSLEDPGFWESEVSKVPDSTLNASSLQSLSVRRCLRNKWRYLQLSMQTLFSLLVLVDALGISGATWK